MQQLSAQTTRRHPAGLARIGLGHHPHDRSEEHIHRRQLWLGIVGAAVLAVILVVTGVVYIMPIGETTYTAELTEANSITTGSDVRVAGITVGKVTGLRLLTDRVRMTFTVRSDIFVGDQSTLDIRMLTLVGGHYVALIPAGTAPLAKKAIPAEHVHLPYSLVRSLQDAAVPVAQVDGPTLRQNITAMQAALAGSPDSLRSIGRSLQSLVTVLSRQDTEVSRALDVTDEFLTVINTNRSLLGTFVRKIGQLEIQGLAKKAEIATALDITGQLLARIAAIEPTWHDKLQPIFHQLTEATPQMQQLIGKLDQSLAALKTIRDRLTRAGGPTIDQSHITLQPAVCIPVPGQGC